jgi:ribosomal protein L37AE/L43A
LLTTAFTISQLATCQQQIRDLEQTTADQRAVIVQQQEGVCRPPASLWRCRICSILGTGKARPDSDELYKGRPILDSHCDDGMITLWAWFLATVLVTSLVIWAWRIIQLDWLPRCPKCHSRGYQHVCGAAPASDTPDLRILNVPDEPFQIWRCRRCRVYRITGPNGTTDLAWDNWAREADQIIAADRTASNGGPVAS